ncbi:hypothetical protein BET10_19890 [Pseudoalteromonas amylolytica]|uniref:Uncharacterized protein n=1 Tax=Pseudoalteromonas amylolytica TaxID=1859457 RepID=A0A1S1MKR9_9GAMM|nr:hypothetical protein BFC16_12870 [Pseudoalteromonas sp. JW3]OHU88338.1 hypothetical protein BET10_19890 [Pseudoalteromonas amylolytica]
MNYLHKQALLIISTSSFKNKSDLANLFQTNLRNPYFLQGNDNFFAKEKIPQTPKIMTSIKFWVINCSTIHQCGLSTNSALPWRSSAKAH